MTISLRRLSLPRQASRLKTLDVEDLARRFWVWGEENGLGMGNLTGEVLARFGGARPQRARGKECEAT